MRDGERSASWPCRRASARANPRAAKPALAIGGAARLLLPPVTGRNDAPLSALIGVDPLVNGGDALHPGTPVGMLHCHDFGLRPVQVIGDEGYLLAQAAQGVAQDPPSPGPPGRKRW